MLGEPNFRSRKLKLQGLDADAEYVVDGKTYLGETLMSAGLILQRAWGDFKAQIIEIHEK